MEFIVTGCVGFIGSAVSERLLADGHVVVGVDEMNDAYDVRLKEWRLARLRPRKGFTFHRADLRDPAAVASLMRERRFDGVFNLAARAGVRQSIEDPRVYLETNAGATLNLLEQCRLRDVPKLLLASTSSLYGGHNERPFREDADTDRPLSPYAASKKAAEALVAAHAHLYGLDAPVVRYFTVYGPAGRPDMSVFRFIRWIAEGEPITLYGDGSQERDFTYVDDIARGTLAALAAVRGFEVVNLGNDRPVPISRLVSEVERLVGRRATIERRPFHPADVRATWADISKARRLLGWEPKVSFEEGLRLTVDWYVANRGWVKDVDLGAR